MKELSDPVTNLDTFDQGNDECWLSVGMHHILVLYEHYMGTLKGQKPGSLSWDSLKTESAFCSLGVKLVGMKFWGLEKFLEFFSVVFTLA